MRKPVGRFNDNYLSKDTTNIVKGFFIALIFMSHIQGYIQNSGYSYDAFGDQTMRGIQHFIGQLVVAMFLFYSGYGIMESYKKKGSAYVATMPRKRLAGTLINFDVAVVAFIMVNLLLGIPMSVKQCALSLIAWESVGNSNWYIFVILSLYLIIFISLMVMCKAGVHRTLYSVAVFIFVSLIVYAILVRFKSSWWYDTFFCFSAGIIFSLFKKKIQSYLDRYYWMFLIISIFLFFSTKFVPFSFMGVRQNINAIMFCFMIVIITRKINLKSMPLKWMGERLFPLYIYQRIPMLMIYHINSGDFVANHVIYYVSICAVITFVIAYTYKYFSISI